MRVDVQEQLVDASIVEGTSPLWTRREKKIDKLFKVLTTRLTICSTAETQSFDLWQIKHE